MDYKNEFIVYKEQQISEINNNIKLLKKKVKFKDKIIEEKLLSQADTLEDLIDEINECDTSIYNSYLENKNNR